MGNDPSRIEVVNGDRRAVFVHTDKGWAPDWFCQGERPMLRFKDHEWLSIGHVHPAFAEKAQRVRGGAAFSGTSTYGTVAVAWTVTVRPDKLSGGFVIECMFKPAETLELLEAYSTFETPYDYDGTETVTTVIGQNPIEKWQGDTHVTPAQWRHAVWSYSRKEAVRMTGPCNIPFICQAIQSAHGDRFTTVIGDWTVCKVRDVYVTPTRTVSQYLDAWAENKSAALRGYKFIVGALNWSSAFAKDPNVLYKGGAKHRQRVAVSFDSAIPGGSLDTMLYAAWQRAAAFDLPADGHVEALDRAAGRGISWGSAVGWLGDTFCGDGVEGLYLAGKGITTYARGSRPKAGDDYGWYWWSQWAGGFHYQALLKGDHRLDALCQKLDAVYTESIRKNTRHASVGISSLPTILWVNGPGRGGSLADAVKTMLQNTYDASVAQNGADRTMDFGTQSTDAEGLLIGAGIFDRPDYRAQALLLLDEINAELDNRFWWFGNTTRESMFHGGQIRPMGHGHAAMANWLAWRATGDGRYLAAARRFARLLLAINYVTHNASHDPDFDWRGWANGTIAGRDQYAEFPPWETGNPLMCVAAMMDDVDLEEGFYDVLWYFARTGLAQFPAARTVKRILDESMAPHFVPRASIASERDYYDILPYLAYENPHDQTLLASYQGTDCLVGELVFGGGLASAEDVRLGAIVPKAAMMDPQVQTSREVHVWNPTPKPIESAVTVTWPDGSAARQAVDAPPRKVVKLQFER